MTERIDEELENDGFEFLRVVENRDFVNQMQEFLRDFELKGYRDFKIIPSDIARRFSNHSGREDTHSVYVKK